MTAESKSVYIRLSQRDIARIDAEARRHGVTRSAIARHAIRAWLRARRRFTARSQAADSSTYTEQCNRL